MKWYKRKLLKAVVYRCVSLGATFLGAFLVTREPIVATGTMIIVETFHAAVYIVFEFAWRPIKYKYLKPVNAFLRYPIMPFFTLRCDECGEISVFVREKAKYECRKCGVVLK